MTERNHIFGLSSMLMVIIMCAIAKFAIHMYSAPEYGFYGDELYTLALSRHLAFGYVDLPPLVPALVALSRTLLGESLFALHIFPALAGAATLVFVCLITREFGGKTFAVLLSALGFIAVPIWLDVDSIFCYDSIDQLVLAAFLYVLVRLLRSGNRQLWLLLGLIAGIAGLTKMTILYLGPGFLIAFLLSKHRRDLLTRWPWLGAASFVIVVSPYLLWQFANGWPTLEYWINYGTLRVYQASLPAYLTNLLVRMSFLLLPFWLVGLYRIFRPFGSVDYSFLGLLFAITLTIMFILHASTRMLAELFMPLLAAGAVFVEELSAGARQGKWIRAGSAAYLLVMGVFSILISLPMLPLRHVQALVYTFRLLNPPIREFNAPTNESNDVAAYTPLLLSGRRGWEELVRMSPRRTMSCLQKIVPRQEFTLIGSRLPAR